MAHWQSQGEPIDVLAYSLVPKGPESGAHDGWGARIHEEGTICRGRSRVPLSNAIRWGQLLPIGQSVKMLRPVLGDD